MVINSDFAILHLMVPRDPTIFGVPVDFIPFGLTLVCIGVFHRHTMRVALAGLVTVVFYKILFTGFKTGTGVAGFVSHVHHEWPLLANLFCLLMLRPLKSLKR